MLPILRGIISGLAVLNEDQLINSNFFIVVFSALVGSELDDAQRELFDNTLNK